MKILTILLICITPVLADDFKTVNGKEYKNATITRVEPDGIIVKSKVGISKVYFSELPKEIQERFHYDPAKAAQFNAAAQNAILQANIKTQQEADAQKQAIAANAQQEQARREAQAE